MRSIHDAAPRGQVVYAGEVPPPTRITVMGQRQASNNTDGRSGKPGSKVLKKKKPKKRKELAPQKGNPLDYTIHVDNIADFLKDPRLELPQSIGIYGSRGIGKTGLLKQIEVSVACDNGALIHPATRCNLKDDCGDNSDEKNCESDIVNLPRKKVKSKEKLTSLHWLFWMFAAILVSACISSIVIFGLVLKWHRTAYIWIAPLIPAVMTLFFCLLFILYACNVFDLRRKSNPMHWILGIYLDLINPPRISPDSNREPKRSKVAR